jgi:hypothetical protein
MGAGSKSIRRLPDSLALYSIDPTLFGLVTAQTFVRELLVSPYVPVSILNGKIAAFGNRCEVKFWPLPLRRLFQVRCEEGS